MGRWTTRLTLIVAAMAIAFVFVPSAGAVLVRTHNGQVAGVTPIRGVKPASIPGSFAGPASGLKPFSSNGNLDYNGGPVLHATAPYLIFWDPNNKISAAEKSLFERYFADVAHDSASATNVYSVDRQYTDSSGFADYSQTWSSAQAITDTHAYPSTGQCTENIGYVETACLYDSQLQAEVQRLITADSLPSGYTGTAPIYFVITPPTVNSCFSDNATCADNFFCAYHSASSSDAFLYADIPLLLAANDPKGCQSDGNAEVQAPNSNPLVDVAIKYLSHEDNESITDPLGNAWWDDETGQEDGDNCNFTGAFDPGAGTNPDAFLPTLGGSASAGTLYDQLINGNQYYIQSEWSNGNVNCEMRPASATLTPAFAAPAAANPTHSVSFDPSASSSSAGYTSVTWNFGDGSAPHFSTGGPATVTHTFATTGTYTVTLTEVDSYGNLRSVSHTIDVRTGPVAAFSYSPAHPQTTTSVSFDGSASTDYPGSLTTYTWKFGDGPTTASGATTSHTYTAPGTYTVTLTVGDGTNTDQISYTVKVDAVPVAAFTITTPSPVAGSPTAFDGSTSSETGGSIVSYSWDFGDGSAAGSGATPSHTYATPGPYTVTLTVTDQDGHQASISHSVPVAAPPAPAFSFSPTTPALGTSVSFDASGSTDPGGTINDYKWDFGDGTTSDTGLTDSASHTYTTAGPHTVTLTVTDNNTHTASISHSVDVIGAPVAAFTITTASPVLGVPVAFNGSASNQPGGGITQYSWSFGDGGSTSGSSPTASHTYSSSGTYTVTLTVTGSDLETAHISHTVTIPPIVTLPSPGQPTARITLGTAHPVAGWAVPLSAAASTDTGSAITSWHWGFGDGTAGSGQTLSHTFAKPGTYPVTLTVTDGSNASNTATLMVKVGSASITSVSVKKGTKVERLTLQISGPGRLIAGSKRSSIKHPEAFTLSVKLSQAQRNRLKGHHSVKVSVKLKFVPSVGTASSKTVRFTVKP